ncbi:MAG: alkaline phosphatase family protein [Hyphomicrobium sp.]|uniref:nucleotide pyrophosphatase/phosphodiesterase family protein n=1 Tax=Hyphomicrobium sp. TaxID=82 RepID=UPI0013210DEC|nr:nucleotide pyrophosphatase/phosphodiesterase family protein [Hyphomicrobium sp.]KAB2942025.1 MAG: alkaline phosphatase family protein [Hyphomicrobium sp.]MBZ0210543.1 alkaline phosphatase family protein [Hyphomicrobium sp.]
MHPLVVLNIVGLTPELVGVHTPNLARLAQRGGLRPLRTVTPAVTCSVQATFLTGLPPGGHGAVGNGWLFRDLYEIWLWRQSNRLLSGERVWDAGKRRNPRFTCANMFWWYNMASSADYAVTPRPIYKADGRKIPDCYAQPSGLRDELTAKLGPFPLFSFWGPATSIASTRWIADAALHVIETRNPTLTLVYLPHLDYGLQRLGPDNLEIAKDLHEVDGVAGTLIDAAEACGRKVLIVSEYGIVPVRKPVHINRALRQAGLLTVRDELGDELLDPPQSRAFAVADHQVAHVYVADGGDIARVRALLERIDGIAEVWGTEEMRVHGLEHERCGELVAIARPDAWFTYYYWLDDAGAPDFARTVEIHRKPGYDPVELFLDPAIRFPKLAIGWRLLKRTLGMRTLMDVIPLDASLVRGSHGRADTPPARGPLVLSSDAELLPEGTINATDIKQLMLDHVFGRLAKARNGASLETGYP